ncbi:hypothetical protein QYM36_003169 [Artemia franciscana]|uniref:Uncharacterized protein n=1 Tax=Artemia franciscana TaxID=6661 RepID=A0AA88IL75_ARTSF|nr:hypothetical protein QYM36_003169 [Artemia franciscana]
MEERYPCASFQTQGQQDELQQLPRYHPTVCCWKAVCNAVAETHNKFSTCCAPPQQARSTPRRSIAEQIYTIRHIVEKALEYNKKRI